MNKAEVIKGLNMVISGFEMLRDAYEGDAEETAEKKVSAPAKKAVGGKKAPAKPAKKESKDSSGGQTYTVEELSGMKYNEFKKLASSLGVDCKGTRDEIMERVIATGVVEDAEGDAPAPAKKAVGGKSNKSASAGKAGAKKADANSGDEFDEKAEEVAKTLSVEEIIEALKDVDVKATKLNYKKKLAEALREGLIDLDEEEEETEAGGDEDFNFDDYYEEYDLSKANDPENMSEERAAACVAKQEEILTAISNEELTMDDLVEFLQSNGTQEELDLLGEDYEDSDIVKLFIEVSKHFIDEEGEEHEPGDAYMIGEDAYCCGQPLAYDKKTRKFLCSYCGADYEAE